MRTEARMAELRSRIEQADALREMARQLQQDDQTVDLSAVDTLKESYLRWYRSGLALVDPDLRSNFRSQYETEERDGPIKKFLQGAGQKKIGGWLYPASEYYLGPLGKQSDLLAETLERLRTPVPSDAEKAAWISRRGVRITAAATITAAIIGGFVAWRVADDESSAGDGPTQSPTSSTPPPSTPQSPPTTPGITKLSELKPCESLPTDSPLAMQLRARRQAVVDGRCYYPDPRLDIGAHQGPTHDSAGVTHLKTDFILENICLKSGQVRQDSAGSRDANWVNFQLDAKRRPYVPAIWTHGEEGARPC